MSELTPGVASSPIHDHRPAGAQLGPAAISTLVTLIDALSHLVLLALAVAGVAAIGILVLTIILAMGGPR